MKINTIRSCAAKCHRVIKSCQTLDQLNTANNYIHLFWRRACWLAEKYDLDIGVGVLILLEDALMQKEEEILGEI
jgi:hypothetical protein